MLPTAQNICGGHARLTERVPELDGLRGIAIALVLYFHCFVQAVQGPLREAINPLVLPGRSGWTGVDLFFVLSGFLIGGILLDARSSTNYFRVFYTRRFFRIVPCYVALLVTYYGLCTLGTLGKLQQFQWQDAWGMPWYVSALFLQNFWIAMQNTWQPGALSILWSLSVEEQFYLTLPWLVRFQDQKRLLHLAAEGVVLAVCLRLLMFKLFPWNSKIWYVMMPCRADALLLGFVGAILWRDEAWRARFADNRGLHRALLVVLAAGIPFFTWEHDNPFGRPLISVGLTWIAFFYFLLLMYALVHKQGSVARLLRWRWLRWLGGIAYGVYLFHRLFAASLAAFVWHRNRDLGIFRPLELLLQILMIAVLLIFCRLLFIYFERPLLQRGHKVSYDFPPADGTSIATPGDYQERSQLESGCAREGHRC